MKESFVCNRRNVSLQEISCVEAFSGEHFCLYTDGKNFYYTYASGTREVIKASVSRDSTFESRRNDALLELKSYVAELYAEAYKDFMCNPENEYNCDSCMENIGQTWPEFILPCGQQNCWVTAHNRKIEL